MDLSWFVQLHSSGLSGGGGRWKEGAADRDGIEPHIAVARLAHAPIYVYMYVVRLYTSYYFGLCVISAATRMRGMNGDGSFSFTAYSVC